MAQFRSDHKGPINFCPDKHCPEPGEVFMLDDISLVDECIMTIKHSSGKYLYIGKSACPKLAGEAIRGFIAATLAE